MQRASLAVLIFLLPLFLLAQAGKVSLAEQVRDKAGKQPLAFATSTLRSTDSSFVAGTITRIGTSLLGNTIIYLYFRMRAVATLAASIFSGSTMFPKLFGTTLMLLCAVAGLMRLAW